ncbi:MAG: hypothetical protein ABH879_04905 [archaeon]
MNLFRIEPGNERIWHIMLFALMIILTVYYISGGEHICKNNSPPVIDAIGNKTIRINEIYNMAVSATDPDNDQVFFEDSTPMFDIDSSGRISFIPSDKGTYKIAVVAYDRCLAASDEVFQLTIIDPMDDSWLSKGSRCGNRRCEARENCQSCPMDCGQCSFQDGLRGNNVAANASFAAGLIDKARKAECDQPVQGLIGKAEEAGRFGNYADAVLYAETAISACSRPKKGQKFLAGIIIVAALAVVAASCLLWKKR